MTPTSQKKILSALMILSFVSVLFEFFWERISMAGIFLVATFFFGAMRALQSPKIKGFAFTLFVFSATTCAMFFPQLFMSFYGFPLKELIVPLLIVLMFGMGAHLSFTDFVGIVKTPKPVLIGIICHYVVMPLVGFILANSISLPPEIAAGIILVGCCPSGMASNVMAFISGGNLPLSVTITALSTLLSPVMTPLLMKLLAGHLISVNFWEMLWQITQLVILPVIAGLIYNKFLFGKLPLVDSILPSVSMVSIVIIITLITAAGRNSLLTIGPLLILVVGIHNLTGYFLGYRLSKLLGLREDESRTIAFEVGMQNAGMASGIALKMGYVATLGLAPAIFGPMQNITASTVAAWWRDKKI